MKKLFTTGQNAFIIDGHWYCVEKGAEKVINNQWLGDAGIETISSVTKDSFKCWPRKHRGEQIYSKQLYGKIILTTNPSLGIPLFEFEKEVTLKDLVGKFGNKIEIIENINLNDEAKNYIGDVKVAFNNIREYSYKNKNEFSREDILKVQQAILCNHKDAVMNVNYGLEFLEQSKQPISFEIEFEKESVVYCNSSNKTLVPKLINGKVLAINIQYQ